MEHVNAVGGDLSYIVVQRCVYCPSHKVVWRDAGRARLGNTWTITLGKDLTSSLLGIFILFYHQIFVRILLASYLEEIL